MSTAQPLPRHLVFKRPFTACGQRVNATTMVASLRDNVDDLPLCRLCRAVLSAKRIAADQKLQREAAP